MRKQRKRKQHGTLKHTEVVIQLDQLRPVTPEWRATLADAGEFNLKTAPPAYAEHAQLVNACLCFAVKESGLTFQKPPLHVVCSEDNWLFVHMNARWPRELGGLFLSEINELGQMIPPGPNPEDAKFVMGLASKDRLGEVSITDVPWDSLSTWDTLSFLKFAHSLTDSCFMMAEKTVAIGGYGRWGEVFQQLGVDAPIVGFLDDRQEDK